MDEARVSRLGRVQRNKWSKTAKGGAKSKPTRAGRPTKQELDRRKRKIMQVATELFLEQGYAATSLVDIAKLAGVATRTVYQNFGDKEAVFRSVMFAPEKSAVFLGPETDEDAALADRMMQAALEIIDISFRQETSDLMRLAIAESRRFPTLIRRLVEGSFSRFEKSVAQFFDQLVAQGVIKDGDTVTSARMFIDIVLGVRPILVYAGAASSVMTEDEIIGRLDLFMRAQWGLNYKQPV